MRFARALLMLAVCAWSPTHAFADAPTTLTLWHAYGETEARGLHEAVVRFEAAHSNVHVTEVAIPFGAYRSKLQSAIPTGHGPDVFIAPHDRIESDVADHLISPIDRISPPIAGDFEDAHLRALYVNGALYGLPLALKCAALYVNDDLVAKAPHELADIEHLRATLPADVTPLLVEGDSAYYAAAFLYAYGGEFLHRDGSYGFASDAATRAAIRLRTDVTRHVIPEETNGVLIAQLFGSGHGATAVSGPWLAADLPATLHYHVATLPMIDGERMRPLVTVEAAMLSAKTSAPELANQLIRFLASADGALPRTLIGKQVPASRTIANRPEFQADSFLSNFRKAAIDGVVMPTHPHMSAAFEPANRALKKILRGDASARDALVEGQHRFDVMTRPLPRERNSTEFLLAIGALLLLATAAMARRVSDATVRAEIRSSLPAYRYVLHAVIAVGLLVIIPLVVGALTSFFAGHGRDMHYVGIANYIDILTAQGGSLLAHGSFWLVLIVTVLWTAANLALHVTLGVGLALLLHRPLLKMRGIYRVILILPWAVPSYVTALAWKSMFNRQFGAINAWLQFFGVDPISWFAHFSTAFAANLATNTWLGFPFMMVMTLAALAAIPKDLYEAAAVDGATAVQRFRFITLPLLAPALAPAIAMGAVWTFNMFNVVFLVSGGEPDGTTEILVSEAYRWAFTRSQQYGYAAAYAVLIFLLLQLTRSRPQRNDGAGATR